MSPLSRTVAVAVLTFVSGVIGPFVSRLREEPGKDIWLMGGGDLIASFLDAHAIDEFPALFIAAAKQPASDQGESDPDWIRRRGDGDRPLVQSSPKDFP